MVKAMKMLRPFTMLDDAPWTWQYKWTGDAYEDHDFFDSDDVKNHAMYYNVWDSLDDSPVTYHITEVPGCPTTLPPLASYPLNQRIFHLNTYPRCLEHPVEVAERMVSIWGQGLACGSCVGASRRECDSSRTHLFFDSLNVVTGACLARGLVLRDCEP